MFGWRDILLAMRTISAFGSGEFQPWSVEVDRVALDRATNGDGSAVIVPIASAPEGEEVFGGWAQMGLDHYGSMQVPARVSLAKTREDANDPLHIDALDSASIIYFSGGNPAYVCETLRDTPYWTKVLELLDAGTALAGCSAGACMLGETAPDSAADDQLTSGDEPADWFVPGLRVIPGVTFGPHWNMLGIWVPGLEDLIRGAVAADQTLIAIDDDTAILGDGEVFTVYGTGTVQIAPAGQTTDTYTASDSFRLPG